VKAKLTEHVVAQPAGLDVNTNVLATVPTFVNLVPPLGRSENVAVWVWEVVGQSDAESLTHEYVPRKVTMSL
jgi:hypothetical protein